MDAGAGEVCQNSFKSWASFWSSISIILRRLFAGLEHFVAILKTRLEWLRGEDSDGNDTRLFCSCRQELHATLTSGALQLPLLLSPLKPIYLEMASQKTERMLQRLRSASLQTMMTIIDTFTEMQVKDVLAAAVVALATQGKYRLLPSCLITNSLQTNGLRSVTATCLSRTLTWSHLSLVSAFAIKACLS